MAAIKQNDNFALHKKYIVESVKADYSDASIVKNQFNLVANIFSFN